MSKYWDREVEVTTGLTPEQHKAAAIRQVVLSAISDLERLNEVLSAGIADQVRVREIIEKLKGAVE